ncbi:metal-dependent hydrolases of the beta-lactamase superfamily I [Paenibacillus sp. JCM 10914]|nr:metal-dependent hydrolases of the beta-lactamase superfamily I [Paenibacillus sp. JCM 10914]
MNRRFRSAVYVESLHRDGDHGVHSFMIDCGPDWRTMMEGRGQRKLSDMLVTHAHFDHIGGLPEWADACRWLGEKGRLYAPAEVLEQIVRQYRGLADRWT